MRVLISGDSFAADWSIAKDVVGWPNLLARDFDVVNVAQAGCGEYKIYKQLQASNLSQFDAIVVAHTSPNRLYVKEHPVHHSSKLHQNSDLIYADIKEYAEIDDRLDGIVDYFENYFDIEYAEFVHNLICKEIDSFLQPFNGKVIHITGFDWNNLYKFDSMQNFSNLAAYGHGFANHFDDSGNQTVYQSIKKMIQ